MPLNASACRQRYVRGSAAAVCAALLAACAQGQQPFSTSFGVLRPGSTLVVRATAAQIDAYKPEIGKPASQFTIQATSARPGAIPTPPRLRGGQKTLIVAAGAEIGNLLVRVPSGVALDASSSAADVNVTDITGAVVAHSDHGDVKVMVPGYAQASTGPGNGNVTVYMGSNSWPGVLHFSAQQGDVEVWINATASFHARLHTDHGTIFTDFGLTGGANGESETIDGSIGNTRHGIDVEVHDGSIRLLQLKPQM